MMCQVAEPLDGSIILIDSVCNVGCGGYETTRKFTALPFTSHIDAMGYLDWFTTLDAVLPGPGTLHRSTGNPSSS